MNNRVSMQSPNFKMAYKVANTGKMANYLNKQKPETIKQLNKDMNGAIKALEGTKFTDTFLSLDINDEKLYHVISYEYPRFNENGDIYYITKYKYCDHNIPNAIKETLEKENEMQLVNEYATEQSNILHKARS